MDSNCWKILMNQNINNELANNIHRSYRMTTMQNQGVSAKTVFENVNRVLEQQFTTNQTAADELVYQLEDLIREKYQTIQNDSLTTVYRPFFDIVRDSHKPEPETANLLPFFTTNYDMSIDWYFYPQIPADRNDSNTWQNNLVNGMTIKLTDGFAFREEWDQQLFNNLKEDDASRLQVPYHKLHGSLFWEEGNGVIHRNSNIARDKHLGQKLVLVYPSDKKVLTENPYYYSHRAMDDYLLRADKLFVIGFSFRDPALVQAFSYGLSANDKLHIYVVHPQFEADVYPEMQLFISQNTGKVTHLPMYFGTDDFLDEFQTIVES